MADLKELIELELVSFLEWPSDDKNIVTTASAKLFAEHMARLYADHIHKATKKIGRRQIREVFLRNGARIEPDRDDLPDYVYESVFELLEMAAPAGQGEPVAISHDCSEQEKQNAEQQPVYQRCEYCDGTGDVHSLDGEWRGTCICPAGQQPAPDVPALVEALAALRGCIMDTRGPDAHSALVLADAALAAHSKGGDA